MPRFPFPLFSEKKGKLLLNNLQRRLLHSGAVQRRDVIQFALEEKREGRSFSSVKKAFRIFDPLLLFSTGKFFCTFTIAS